MRDRVHKLLDKSGAFNLESAISCSGNNWLLIACVDRLVELGEIMEIKRDNIPSQYRVFVRKGE